MNALQWVQFLERQKAQGKTIFTVTELAHAAGHSLPVARMTAMRLVRRGALARAGQGRYMLPAPASAASIARSIDEGSYVTAEGALYIHGIATQAPANWTCFTNKRHGRSRVRKTSVGQMTFVCVSSSIYNRPPGEAMAPPEQAFCDYVHMAQRAGWDPTSLLTLRHLERLTRHIIQRLLPRYPPPVQDRVRRILATKRQRARRK